MLFKRQPKERAALYAKTMSGIRYYHDGRFAVIAVTKKNMEECGADQGMTEGFVDFPLNIDGVEVAASLLEIKKGQCKISLRSKTYADVNKIAGTYGGGGHVRAAGCMLFGDLEDVLDRLSSMNPASTNTSHHGWFCGYQPYSFLMPSTSAYLFQSSLPSW